jgi:hypothetical protein
VVDDHGRSPYLSPSSWIWEENRNDNTVIGAGLPVRPVPHSLQVPKARTGINAEFTMLDGFNLQISRPIRRLSIMNSTLPLVTSLGGATKFTANQAWVGCVRVKQGEVSSIINLRQMRRGA